MSIFKANTYGRTTAIGFALLLAALLLAAMPANGSAAGSAGNVYSEPPITGGKDPKDPDAKDPTPRDRDRDRDSNGNGTGNAGSGDGPRSFSGGNGGAGGGAEDGAATLAKQIRRGAKGSGQGEDARKLAALTVDSAPSGALGASKAVGSEEADAAAGEADLAAASAPAGGAPSLGLALPILLIMTALWGIYRALVSVRRRTI